MRINIKSIVHLYTPPLLWAGFILIVSATPEPLSRLLGDTQPIEAALTVFGINILGLLDYPYHFLVYFVLAFLAARAIFWRRVPTTRQLLRVFVLVMVIAVVDEVQQLFIPTRNFEVIDLVMDGLGAAAGLVFFVKVGIVKQTEYRGPKTGEEL